MSEVLTIKYKPNFIRQFNRLEEDLQEEVLEKIESFKYVENHKQLKVHKLNGRLKGRYSFSVNYRTRIVFIYESKKDIVLLAIGDHEVYKI